MKKYIIINNNGIKIPALLWGEVNNKMLIAIHGDLSNKEDAIIKRLTERAISKGYCVLSFDLPEHGERKGFNYDCNPQNCISDILAVYYYAKSRSSEISLFACSIGACFGFLALGDKILHKALLLSPVVNMERVIQNMMIGFQVSEQRLKREKKIALPIGKTLDWDYYTYIKEHPISLDKTFPIMILYGSKDSLLAKEDIVDFTRRYNAELTTLENAEHYFYTDEQLIFFELWVNDNL